MSQAIGDPSSSAFRTWAQREGLRGSDRNRNAETSREELNASILKKLRVLRKRVDTAEA